MKVEPAIRQYTSREDYLARKATSATVPQTPSPSPSPSLTPAPKVTQANSAEIANEAKPDDLPQDRVELGSKNPATEGGKRALSAALEASVRAASAKVSPELKARARAMAKEVDHGPAMLNRPAVMVVRGMQLWSGAGNNGLPAMAKHLEGAELFGWREEGKILQEILRRRPDRPVILIGHGLGADTAVSVANKLNTMENGFRRVDLLVTMDSVGFNNDIIPPNVKHNLNFIGDKDVLLNDAPNIARDTALTEVTNELRPEGHDELAESPGVQFKVFDAVRKVLLSTKELGTPPA